MTDMSETRRRATWTPELVRGAIGGVISGAVFLVLNMWLATSMDQPAKMPILMMSTIVKGNDAIATGAANVGTGLAVHVILSLAFGVAFALVAVRLRTNGSVALAGTAYGGLLYVVNFKVFAPAVFEVFEDANQPFELVAHLVFGVLVALSLFSVGARRNEPILALESATR